MIIVHALLLSREQISLISSTDREVTRLYITANAPHAFVAVIYQLPFQLFSPIFGRWQATLKIVCTLRAGTIAQGAVVVKRIEQWPLYKRHPRPINHGERRDVFLSKVVLETLDHCSLVNMQKNGVKFDTFFGKSKKIRRHRESSNQVVRAQKKFSIKTIFISYVNKNIISWNNL